MQMSKTLVALGDRAVVGVSKSGTAIGQHRPSARAEVARGGGAREGGIFPLSLGGSGDLPRDFLKL